MTRLFSVAFLFLIICAGARATPAQAIVATGSAAIIIRSPDRIVVAADSKISTEQPGVTQSICKIRQVDDLFFVSTGFLGSPINNFDITRIAVTACKQGGTIHEKMARFERLVVPPLAVVLRDIKHRLPNFYQQHYQYRPVFTITFIGREDGELSFVTRDFEIPNPEAPAIEPKITAEDCPGDCPDGGYTTIFGEVAEMLKYLKAHPGLLNSDKPIDRLIASINLLMKVGIKAHPSSIGMPINILVIDKNGPRWLQKQRNCPAID